MSIFRRQFRHPLRGRMELGRECTGMSHPTVGIWSPAMGASRRFMILHGHIKSPSRNGARQAMALLCLARLVAQCWATLADRLAACLCHERGGGSLPTGHLLDSWLRVFRERCGRMWRRASTCG